MASIINNLPSSISVRVGTNLVAATVGGLLVSTVSAAAIQVLRNTRCISFETGNKLERITQVLELATFMMLAGTSAHVAVCVGAFMAFYSYASVFVFDKTRFSLRSAI